MATSVELPQGMEEVIEVEVETGLYSSKSEYIRAAIRDKMENEGKIERQELSDETVEQIKRSRGRSSDDRVPHEEVK
ncbi:MAG: type II toxin-antitoxin system ParD family antitoxin, partial [Candidatus Nanohaloarchaea archaeon]|nr:type II toxin-antitoxin system ParD family antitoxin [Candidatus Nanohaloarchaea archaeon]